MATEVLQRLRNKNLIDVDDEGKVADGNELDFKVSLISNAYEHDKKKTYDRLANMKELKVKFNLIGEMMRVGENIQTIIKKLKLKTCDIEILFQNVMMVLDVGAILEWVNEKHKDGTIDVDYHKTAVKILEEQKAFEDAMNKLEELEAQSSSESEAPPSSSSSS